MLAIVRSLGGRVVLDKNYLMDLDGDLVLTRTESRCAYVFEVQAVAPERQNSGKTASGDEKKQQGQ